MLVPSAHWVPAVGRARRPCRHSPHGIQPSVAGLAPALAAPLALVSSDEQVFAPFPSSTCPKANSAAFPRKPSPPPECSVSWGCGAFCGPAAWPLRGPRESQVFAAVLWWGLCPWRGRVSILSTGAPSWTGLAVFVCLRESGQQGAQAGARHALTHVHTCSEASQALGLALDSAPLGRDQALGVPSGAMCVRGGSPLPPGPAKGSGSRSGSQVVGNDLVLISLPPTRGGLRRQWLYHEADGATGGPAGALFWSWVRGGGPGRGAGGPLEPTLVSVEAGGPCVTHTRS